MIYLGRDSCRNARDRREGRLAARQDCGGLAVREFGLSAADRLVVTFSDGSAAFVKVARTEETAGWLRNEHRILDHLRGTSLAPEVLGWQDDGTGQPLLVTENLSAGYWPAAGAEDPGGGTSTVWRPGDIDVLSAARSTVCAERRSLPSCRGRPAGRDHSGRALSSWPTGLSMSVSSSPAGSR